MKNHMWILILLMCTSLSRSDALDASWNLFQLVDRQVDQGFVLAPLPAVDLLAAVAYGSAGKTNEEFQTYLFHQMNRKDLSKLAEDTSRSKPGFASITGFWKSQDLNIMADYQKATREKWKVYWGTAPFEEDQTESADLINNWFSAKTNQIVRKVILPGEISPNTDLIGINVCRFKAPWKENLFSAAKTDFAVFHKSKEEKFPVAMMQGQFRAHYYQDENLKASSLPFRGNGISLLLILPHHPADFDSFRENIDSKYFQKILSEAKMQKLSFQLPKVRASMRLNLREILIKSGLKTPFYPTSETDFQYINGNLPEPLYISKAQQQLEVLWDEKGAEATAITVFRGDPFGAPPTPDPNSFHPFIVNHPFVFVIYTTDKKEMLFAGFISDPSQMIPSDDNRP